MRIYVATKFEAADNARAAMDDLVRAGHTITHDWTNENAGTRTGPELDQYMAGCALSDLNGVTKCQALVLLNHPAGKGMFVEMGAALAWGKIVIVVKPEVAGNVFFSLPEVICVQDMAGALTVLGELE